MGKARLAALVGLALFALAGCGGSGSDSSTPVETEAGAAPPIDVHGGADPDDVAVIGAWVDALRSGDVEAAAGYFAIPSVAENGPLLAKIRSRDDAVEFNQSLPCGARLIRAEGTGEITTATFTLTERPGPGRCGAGTGTTAQTAFVIEDGKIVAWRRVGAGGAPGAEGEAV